MINEKASAGPNGVKRTTSKDFAKETKKSNTMILSSGCGCETTCTYEDKNKID